MARKVRLDQTVSWVIAVLVTSVVFTGLYVLARANRSPDEREYQQLVIELQAKRNQEFAEWEKEQKKSEEKEKQTKEHGGGGHEAGDEGEPAEDEGGGGEPDGEHHAGQNEHGSASEHPKSEEHE